MKPHKIFSALGLLWIVFLLAWPAHHPDFSDFWVYHDAGVRALHHETVYAVTGHYQFKYAPTVALFFGALFSPFSSGLTAAWFFYGVNVLLWLGIVFSLLKRVRVESRIFVAGALCFIFGLALKEELRLGQTNGLAILLLWLSLSERGEKTQGSALALAIQFKLYALFAVPVFLFQKKWKAVGAGLLTAAASFGILSLWHGFSFACSESVQWLHSLRESSEELFTSTYNIDLAGTVARWGVPAFAPFLEVAGLVGFVFCLHRGMRSALPDRTLWIFAWVGCAIVLLNPLSWPYWVLFTIPAVIWKIEYSRSTLDRGLLVVILLSFNSLAGYVGKNAGGVLFGTLLLAVSLLQAVLQLQN